MDTLELAPQFVPRASRTAPAPSRSLGGLVLAGVAILSGASGLVHLAAVPEHWANYRIAAVFFAGLGIFQVVWAAMMIGRPSRLLCAAGAAASLGTIAVWAISRISGLPFGPFAGIAERAGRADIISTVLEEALVIGLILLAYGAGEWLRYRRRAYRVALTAIAGVTASVTVWALTALHTGGHGGAGAQSQATLLSELVGYHGLHLLFAGGAVAVYFAYVVGYIRRHGWPSFSWKLNPVVTEARPVPVGIVAPPISMARSVGQVSTAPYSPST
jgi:hypothetical protein